MGEPPSKRAKGQCKLVLAVPSAAAQCFITAELVQEIGQYYSAQVQVFPTDFFLFGEAVRKVIITSTSVEFNTLGQQRISQILDHYDKSGRNSNNALTLRVLIENRYAGLVIGKGGATIKELTAQSMGTKIQLAKKEEMPPDMMASERCVTMIGSLEQITKAQDLMSKKIADFNVMPQGRFTQGKTNTGYPAATQPMYQSQQFSGQMQQPIPTPPVQQPYQHRMQSPTPPNNALPPSMDPRSAAYDEYATQQGKLTIVIPLAYVGIVVGKQGSNLKAAIEQCQNAVRIQQEKQDTPMLSQTLGQSMRNIHITGPIAMAHKAASLLFARIQTHVTNKRCSEWTAVFYPQVNPDAPPIPMRAPHPPPLQPYPHSHQGYQGQHHSRPRHNHHGRHRQDHRHRNNRYGQTHETSARKSDKAPGKIGGESKATAKDPTPESENDDGKSEKNDTAPPTEQALPSLPAEETEVQEGEKAVENTSTVDSASPVASTKEAQSEVEDVKTSIETTEAPSNDTPEAKLDAGAVETAEKAKEEASEEKAPSEGGDQGSKRKHGDI